MVYSFRGAVQEAFEKKKQKVSIKDLSKNDRIVVQGMSHGAKFHAVKILIGKNATDKKTNVSVDRTIRKIRYPEGINGDSHGTEKAVAIIARLYDNASFRKNEAGDA